MVNICYLIAYQPFEEAKIVRLEVMNEATNFILLYHVMCFSKFVPDAETRYLLGWSFIGFMAANMLVHFTLLVIETIGNMKESCQNCCSKKKPEVEEEEPKKK